MAKKKSNSKTAKQLTTLRSLNPIDVFLAIVLGAVLFFQIGGFMVNQVSIGFTGLIMVLIIMVIGLLLLNRRTVFMLEEGIFFVIFLMYRFLYAPNILSYSPNINMQQISSNLATIFMLYLAVYAVLHIIIHLLGNLKQKRAILTKKGVIQFVVLGTLIFLLGQF